MLDYYITARKKKQQFFKKNFVKNADFSILFTMLKSRFKRVEIWKICKGYYENRILLYIYRDSAMVEMLFFTS